MNPKSLNRWRTFFSILLIVSFALGNLSLPTGKVYAQNAQIPTVEPSATDTPVAQPSAAPTLDGPEVSETPGETNGTDTPTIESTFTQTPTLDVTPSALPTDLGELTPTVTTPEGALDFGPMLTIYYKDLPEVDAALQANSAETQAAIDNATVATAFSNSLLRLQAQPVFWIALKHVLPHPQLHSKPLSLQGTFGRIQSRPRCRSGSMCVGRTFPVLPLLVKLLRFKRLTLRNGFFSSMHMQMQTPT